MRGDRNRDKKHQSSIKGEEPEACMKYNKGENDKRNMGETRGEIIFQDVIKR